MHQIRENTCSCCFYYSIIIPLPLALYSRATHDDLSLSLEWRANVENGKLEMNFKTRRESIGDAK